MELSAGDVVENWTVKRRLGSGGMADVYLVEHNQLGSRHALKVMKAGATATRGRLIAEGQMQAKVKHPNLVLVTDMLDVDGDVGLVMQYVDGPTLARWATPDQSLQDAMAVFLSIVDGLGFAHENGFIHRDLKPANIIVQQTAEGWRSRIIDFGLVKAFGGAAKPSNVTNPGSMMGTPEFMAPEQISDAATVDARADMWALGTLLYRLVCGVDAYGPGGMIEILNCVVRADFKQPRVHRADLADTIVHAINGLITVNKDDRIPDCPTLLKVLGVVPDPDGVAAPWQREERVQEHDTWPGGEAPDLAQDEEKEPLAPKHKKETPAPQGAMLSGTALGALLALSALAAVWWFAG